MARTCSYRGECLVTWRQQNGTSLLSEQSHICITVKQEVWKGHHLWDSHYKELVNNVIIYLNMYNYKQPTELACLVSTIPLLI